VAQRSVPVPPVLVEIRDATGRALYQWSVTPELRTLAPGENVKFSTELAAPPAGAQSVHLSFATGNGGTASVSPEHAAGAGHSAAEAAATASGHGEAAHDISQEVSPDTSHSSEGLAGH
jgi:hypothetical protein